MQQMSTNKAYRMFFPKYQDVVGVAELCEMLGISKKAAYKLLSSGEVGSFKVGKNYKIPKINIINYMQKASNANYATVL